ncbi:putative uncharacterized protein DDB_G0287183 [Homalodisca vitripennis]|uniref:putative uncharacterized protein DDB_G0287183 n=1 Tax=Homalodisca vitripennis TaxID=197043 RepID=UPI001EEBB8FE|nr:putative uncharacterized protein DDB_G0287183 [Homalodisca vitripennis]
MNGYVVNVTSEALNSQSILIQFLMEVDISCPIDTFHLDNCAYPSGDTSINHLPACSSCDMYRFLIAQGLSELSASTTSWVICVLLVLMTLNMVLGDLETAEIAAGGGGGGKGGGGGGHGGGGGKGGGGGGKGSKG